MNNSTTTSTQVTIIKRKMPIAEEKDLQNSLAMAEKFNAFMDYIAVCDHPEMIEEEEDVVE